MAYFVRIGSIKKNKYGVGARGFQLFRRDCVVITRWGSVEVGSDLVFYWGYKTPQEKRYHCSSPERAVRRYKELLRHRVEVESYDRLPAGAFILRRATRA